MDPISGLLGVPAEVVVFSQRRTTLKTMRLFDEGRCMTSHVRIEPGTEIGNPTPIPPDMRVGSPVSGGRGDPFFSALYVDDIAPVHVQNDDGDNSALQVSVSLAFDCFRVFGPRDPGETPILSQAKSTHWGVKLSFLGWYINSHTDRISLPYGKVGRRRDTFDERPPSTRHRPRKKSTFVLRTTGKLWNVTFVFRARKYFV